jgi:cytoskeletal protein CcmA (bactofilin family)
VSKKSEQNGAACSGSLIGAGTVFVGDLVFSGALRIDGEVKGDVIAHDGQGGNLVIGENGRVDGDIDVRRLTVSGAVTGHILAREFVELLPKARVTCDVEYAAAQIHLGALVHGRLVQRPDFPPRARATPQPAKVGLAASA